MRKRLTYRQLRGIDKAFNITNYQGNAQQQWDIISFLKWLSFERQGITAVGKDIEKREPLCTVSEIVNCASTMKNIMRFGIGMYTLLYLKQLASPESRNRRNIPQHNKSYI